MAGPLSKLRPGPDTLKALKKTTRRERVDDVAVLTCITAAHMLIDLLQSMQ